MRRLSPVKYGWLLPFAGGQYRAVNSRSGARCGGTRSQIVRPAWAPSRRQIGPESISVCSPVARL